MVISQSKTILYFRNPTNLNNSNYYHLGSRLGATSGLGNYHLMDNNPYNTTLSVPIAQSLQTGYNNARVSGPQNVFIILSLV